MNAVLLSPEKPIYHVGYSNEIIALYEEAYKTAQEEVAFAQQTMAGIVNHLIGKMYSLERNIVLSKDTKHVDMINKARLRIRESLEDTLTIQEIAQELPQALQGAYRIRSRPLSAESETAESQRTAVYHRRAHQGDCIPAQFRIA